MVSERDIPVVTAAAASSGLFFRVRLLSQIGRSRDPYKDAGFSQAQLSETDKGNFVALLAS